MRTILCYGDSNTWGAVPASDDERYPPDVRWPGILARELGEEYEVVESGLGGRTTAFERLPLQYRNGRDLLVPIMETQAPLDLVIILLGTNDVSLPYLSTGDIARGAGELISIVQRADELGSARLRPPRILLVAPHRVGPLEGEDALVSRGAEEKSERLASAYEELAGTMNCEFLDLGPIVQASTRDPWHWEAEGHAAAGISMAVKVREIFEDSA